MRDFLKGFPAGLAAGVVLSVVLWKSVIAGRVSAKGNPGAEAGASAPGAESPEEREAAALKEEIGRLKTESERLAAALESAKKRRSSGAGHGTATQAGGDPEIKGGTRREKNPWSDLGRKLYEMRDKLKDGEDGMEDPEVQALWLEAIEIARKLAEDLGIDLQEFELSPYTLPMIMLAMLDASDLPPEGAQSAALDALMDAAERDWKAFMAGREGLTKLEARLEMVKMTGAMFDGVWGTMTPDQKAIFDKVDMLARDRWASPNSVIGGTRAEISGSVLASWRNALGLSESQSLAVKPVVDDYVRRYSEMQADFARREASGSPAGPTERAVATTELMIDAQRQLSKTVTLNQAQQEKLNSWGTIYGVDIEGE